MIKAGAYAELTGWPNLLLAYRKASKSKRGRADVAAFEARLEENLLAMQEDLANRTWHPGGYHRFYIHDPKRRLISAAPFADRIVHHALCNLIEPVFERSFVAESFANRIGKGNHRALNHAQKCARAFSHVLPLDIRKFFPSTDHGVLRSLLARKIQDEDTLWLIDLILASGDEVDDGYSPVLFPGDDLIALTRPRGLPIGNLTSQFWANVYMNLLDHFIKRTLRCRGYVRYVDDLLIFADSKAMLWEWKKQIEDQLSQLRLTAHPGAHPRPVTEGIPFLGFRVFPDKRRLKRRKGIQYQQRLKAMVEAYQDNAQQEQALLDSVLAWNNHVSYGNTLGLRKAVFASLPEEIALAARSRYGRTRERQKVVK